MGAVQGKAAALFGRGFVRLVEPAIQSADVRVAVGGPLAPGVAVQMAVLDGCLGNLRVAVTEIGS